MADRQGTVRDGADYASGTNTTAVVNHLKYDAYGNITAQSSGTHEPLFAYTGREWDADAELYYYRARWHDPAVGRFVSEDPKGISAGDPNFLRYVGNQATYRTDPTGLEWPYGPAPYVDPEDYFYGQIREIAEQMERRAAEAQQAVRDATTRAVQDLRELTATMQALVGSRAVGANLGAAGGLPYGPGLTVGGQVLYQPISGDIETFIYGGYSLNLSVPPLPSASFNAGPFITTPFNDATLYDGYRGWFEEYQGSFAAPLGLYGNDAVGYDSWPMLSTAAPTGINSYALGGTAGLEGLTGSASHTYYVPTYDIYDWWISNPPTSGGVPPIPY